MASRSRRQDAEVIRANQDQASQHEPAQRLSRQGRISRGTRSVWRGEPPRPERPGVLDRGRQSLRDNEDGFQAGARPLSNAGRPVPTKGFRVKHSAPLCAQWPLVWRPPSPRHGSQVLCFNPTAQGRGSIELDAGATGRTRPRRRIAVALRHEMASRPRRSWD